MEDAACKGLTDLFIPDRTGNRKMLQLAKTYCKPCPVRAECRRLSYADVSYGLWAGLTPADRDEIRFVARQRRVKPASIECLCQIRSTTRCFLHS